jgi:hypothetical protein
VSDAYFEAREAYFLTTLQSEDLPGGGRFRLLEVLAFYSLILNKYILVPRDFICDAYSVPIFCAFLVYNADRRPAFIHDWLCGGHVKGVSRETADLVILEAMKAAGLSWLQRRIIYRGTRVGDYLNIGGQGDETISPAAADGVPDSLRPDPEPDQGA